MTSMKRALVTGGAGFIGSYLVKALLGNGYEVRVLDNLSTGLYSNVEILNKLGKVKFVYGDILDRDLLSESMGGVEEVYHLAAEVGVNRVLKISKQVLWSNDFTGTKYVLEEAANSKVNFVLFASSSEVYGKFDQEKLPMKEEDKFLPDTLYGEAKLKAEGLCKWFSDEYGIATVCTRYFNVYGPRQTLNGYCVPHFIDAALKNEPLRVHGDGTQTRDLTYIDDAIRLTLVVSDPKYDKQVFNIGTGFSISMNDLAKKIINLSNSKSKTEYIPKRRPADGYHKCGDASKILNATGFKPETNLEDGLIECIKTRYEELRG